MALRDLIPWNNGSRELSRNDPSPFLALHREMNRLFDNAFRSFDIGPFGHTRVMSWPSVEVSETDREIKVTAELPGLEEKDVNVELAGGPAERETDRHQPPVSKSEGRARAARRSARFISGRIARAHDRENFENGVRTYEQQDSFQRRIRDRRDLRDLRDPVFCFHGQPDRCDSL